MTVRVALPLGPNNKSLGEIMPYPPFYTLILTYNASGETITQQYENNSSVFIISKLQSDTEYCGSVTYNSGRVNRREKSNATTFCKILPGTVCYNTHSTTMEAKYKYTQFYPPLNKVYAPNSKIPLHYFKIPLHYQYSICP